MNPSDILADCVRHWEARKLADNSLREASDKLADCVKAGSLAVDSVITLADGRRFRVVDNFAKGNTVYRPAPFRQFDFEVVK